MPTGVYARTDYHKHRLSISHMGIPSAMNGRHHTPEAKIKIGLAQLGNKYLLGRTLTDEHKNKIRKSNMGKHQYSDEMKVMARGRMVGKTLFLGRKHTDETKNKISNSEKGKIVSMETKLKLRAVKGSRNHRWKGGLTPIRIQIRDSIKYKKWRNSIFERDRWTCEYCGDNRSGIVEAHHIKSFSVLIRESMEASPMLSVFDAVMIHGPMWDTQNGVTLCKSCHNETKIHYTKLT